MLPEEALCAVAVQERRGGGWWGRDQRLAASPLGSSDTDDRPEPRGGGAGGPTGLYGEKDTARAAGRKEQGSSSVGVRHGPRGQAQGRGVGPAAAAARGPARVGALPPSPPVPCDHAPSHPARRLAGRAAPVRPLPVPPASFTPSNQRTTNLKPSATPPRLKMTMGAKYPRTCGYQTRWTRIPVRICTRGYWCGYNSNLNRYFLMGFKN
jgi:hypothetical protein